MIRLQRRARYWSRREADLFATAGRSAGMSGDLEASFALANRATRRRRTAPGFQRNFTKMNRSDEIDSYLSLDGIRRAGEYAAMLTQPYQLYVERIDKARNMARYYAMAIEPGLFGETA